MLLPLNKAAIIQFNNVMAMEELDDPSTSEHRTTMLDRSRTNRSSDSYGSKRKSGLQNRGD